MRFTIRELVLVTVIVAMGVAWWIDRNQIQTACRDRIKTILSQEGVGDDWQVEFPANDELLLRMKIDP